jgi:dTDP-4-amino-4,6-dideoxygalactose transaminase
MYKNKRVGSFGDISCFSFYPTKNLGAIGDGGMIITNDRNLANKARLLREYGWAQRYVSHTIGWNSRLDEIQAATLRIKLKYLDHDNAKRSQLAEIYRENLSALDEIVLPETRKDSVHVYHLYVIRLKKRNEFQKVLKKRGINTLVHYPIPIHLQPAYYKKLKGIKKLPQTECAASEVLSLPIYPELTANDIRIIIESTKEFFSKKKELST